MRTLKSEIKHSPLAFNCLLPQKSKKMKKCYCPSCETWHICKISVDIVKY